MPQKILGGEAGFTKAARTDEGEEGAGTGELLVHALELGDAPGEEDAFPKHPGEEAAGEGLGGRSRRAAPVFFFRKKQQVGFEQIAELG